MAAGIDVRHRRSCRSREGGRCNCEPTYRVQVWDPRARKLHRRPFTDLAEARAWRDDAGVIRVRFGWDDEEGLIEVKTNAGRRKVPLAGELRRELAAHKLRTGRDAGDLVFGRTGTLPFIPSTARRRAR